MSLLDLRRYKGIGITFLCLAAALVVVDRVGAAVLGPRPRALVPALFVDWERYDTFAGRVASVKRQGTEAPAGFPKRWGIVLGHSSAEQDIDPVVLREHTTLSWLVLAGSGGSTGIENLDFHCALFETSGLKPEVVVLALHPFMFAVPPPEVPPKHDLRKALRARSSRRVLEALRAQSWLGGTQLLFGEAARSRARDVRNAVAHAAAWPWWATYRAAPRPWESNFVNATGQMEAPRLKERIDRSGELGRFDPARYPDGPVRAAHTLRQRIERMGATVIVLAMPEHSAFRRRMPDRAFERLQEGARGIPVEDLRAQMPDDAFWDPYHLNAEGKRTFSAQLGQKLRIP
jgi:hypothetical protein